jgi:hypothetical protein
MPIAVSPVNNAVSPVNNEIFAGYFDVAKRNSAIWQPFSRPVKCNGFLHSETDRLTAAVHVLRISQRR